MAGQFITEKQTEAWLQSETRSLTMPNGTRRDVTAFNLHWLSFDFLTECTCYSEKTLVELALLSQSETGRPFDQSFRNVVAYVTQRVKSTL